MSIVALAVADPALRVGLAGQLHRHGVASVHVRHAHLLILAGAATPRAIILSVDAAVPGSDATIVSIRRRHPQLPLVVIVAHGTEQFAIAALRARVADYYRAPADPECVARALAAHLGGVSRDDPVGEDLLVGEAAAIRDVRAYIGRVAALDTSVLVTGETGTGKELVAAAIHRGGARRTRSLVPVNCAAIPESLLESELFGHEKGAFTGAHTTSEGRLEQADGGTIFFDEIGEMTRLAQAKILRALETREVVRVGGRRPIPVDVRVIAATNQDLEAAVERGDFRKDLYYRLNVARIHLPPLRLRPEDIPVLCHHYLQYFNHRFGRNVGGFTDAAMKELMWYGWPGNVRELKNLLEAVFVNLPSGEITLADLPPMFRAQLSSGARLSGEERHKMLDALLATRWNVSRAAQQLHWSRMTMYRKMAKYRLVKSRDRSYPNAG
jgi:DNA-binding NtrC family response regulator